MHSFCLAQDAVASGVVGSAAALAFLRDGWTVVAVGRDEMKLTELKNCLVCHFRRCSFAAAAAIVERVFVTGRQAPYW